MAPYWFADTKIMKSLNYARIIWIKLGFSYSLFAVLIGGRECPKKSEFTLK
jgi:hypothetical protein